MPRYAPLNRNVLPTNSRVVSVAQNTINHVLPHVARRIENSYRVEGYPVIPYHRLSGGQACCCKVTPSILNQDGSADPSLLNSLLTGGHEFGVIAYGSKPADQNRSVDYDSETREMIMLETEVKGTTIRGPLKEHPNNRNSLTGSLGRQSHKILKRNVPAKYDMDSSNPMASHVPMPGTQYDVFASSVDFDPLASTITPDGVGASGPITNFRSDDTDANPDVFYDTANLPFGFDALSLNDTSCPVCMGTGFVGGYSPICSMRKVFNFQSSNYSGPQDVALEQIVPDCGLQTDVSWSIVFPKHVLSVDAVRLWNKSSPLFGQFYIDNVLINRASDFASPLYCDGKTHIVKFVPSTSYTRSKLRWTHLEIQWAISDALYCDFPKLQKSGSATTFDTTQDISINFGPSMPMLRSHDVIVDSVVGRVWKINDVTPHLTRSRHVLSWEIQASVAQPMEFVNTLPTRKTLTYGPRTIHQVSRTLPK